MPQTALPVRLRLCCPNTPIILSQQLRPARQVVASGMLPVSRATAPTRGRLEWLQVTRGLRRGGTIRASADDRSHEPGPPPQAPEYQAERKQRPPGRTVDSTDPIASALTRRFGFAGGIAWLGLLSFGVISEQVKTRMEVAAEREQTIEVLPAKIEKITLPSGVAIQDLTIGGGASPRQGDLIVLRYSLRDGLSGSVLENGTIKGKVREHGFIYDEGYMDNTYTQHLHERTFIHELTALQEQRHKQGAEEAIRGMRANGRRQAFVPAGLTFKSPQALPQGITAPAFVPLTYELNLERVSPPPG